MLLHADHHLGPQRHDPGFCRVETQINKDVATTFDAAGIRETRIGLSLHDLSPIILGSEDLTRQVIDTEATLRAQTRLRERLTELLTRHQGKLADLLEVERELARVQGEIDARSSELNVMRKRIAMSDLTIAYQSRGLFVDDRTADPTLQALRDFLATVSLSFAAAIRFVAVALPWLLIVLPAFWLLRRMWRRRAGKLRSPDS